MQTVFHPLWLTVLASNARTQAQARTCVKVKQCGLQPVLIWNASATGSSLTHDDIKLVPYLLFFKWFRKKEKQYCLLSHWIQYCYYRMATFSAIHSIIIRQMIIIRCLLSARQPLETLMRIPQPLSKNRHQRVHGFTLIRK